MRVLGALARSTRRTPGVAQSASLSLRQMSCLVLGEAKKGGLEASTKHAIRAAQSFPGPITVLVAGPEARAAAQVAAQLEGVSAVLVAQGPALSPPRAEPMAALVAALHSQATYQHVVAASSSFGRDVLPRAAALMDVQPVADVLEVRGARTFVRPTYAGNALATVEVLGDGPVLMTVRPTAFEAAAPRGAAPAADAVRDVDGAALEAAAAALPLSEHVSSSVQAGGEDKPELAQARVVVAGGRALKSADNFSMLERLAGVLGGAVGASRAAVDAGYVPNDLQVGQTGKIVAPDLYVAVGISGAIQHVAGMKDSKVIVAINSDAEAPIFQIADYGLVGDLFAAVPELEEEVRKAKAA